MKIEDAAARHMSEQHKLIDDIDCDEVVRQAQILDTAWRPSDTGMR